MNSLKFYVFNIIFLCFVMFMSLGGDSTLYNDIPYGSQSPHPAILEDIEYTYLSSSTNRLESLIEPLE